MDFREFENGMNEREALDGDSGKIATLLGALPRVEAPRNFEFGIKARIASGESSRPTAFAPFLKVAASLSLVLLVAAFVFYAVYPGGGDVVAENPTPAGSEVIATVPKTDRSEPAPVASGQQESVMPQPERVSTEPLNAAPGRPAPSRRRQGASSDQPSRGGSFDWGLNAGNTLLPRGFQTQTDGNQNSNSGIAGDIPVREILELLGLNAEFVDDGWKVKSAAGNSSGERSGVRANDIIEAIDGRELKKTTTFKNGSGRTLQIRRDGKQMVLTLRN